LPLSSSATALPPQNNETSLHFAAERGFLGIIDKLLDMGADIETKDELVHSFAANKWRLSIAACASGSARSLICAAASLPHHCSLAPVICAAPPPPC
jgi:hypothetical protein